MKLPHLQRCNYFFCCFPMLFLMSFHRMSAQVVPEVVLDPILYRSQSDLGCLRPIGESLYVDSGLTSLILACEKNGKTIKMLTDWRVDGVPVEVAPAETAPELGLNFPVFCLHELDGNKEHHITATAVVEGKKVPVVCDWRSSVKWSMPVDMSASELIFTASIVRESFLDRNGINFRNVGHVLPECNCEVFNNNNSMSFSGIRSAFTGVGDDGLKGFGIICPFKFPNSINKKIYFAVIEGHLPNAQLPKPILQPLGEIFFFPLERSQPMFVCVNEGKYITELSDWKVDGIPVKIVLQEYVPPLGLDFPSFISLTQLDGSQKHRITAVAKIGAHEIPVECTWRSGVEWSSIPKNWGSKRLTFNARLIEGEMPAKIGLRFQNSPSNNADISITASDSGLSAKITAAREQVVQPSAEGNVVNFTYHWRDYDTKKLAYLLCIHGVISDDFSTNDDVNLRIIDDPGTLPF